MCEGDWRGKKEKKKMKKVYKVLIAEDEKFLLQGLTKYMDEIGDRFQVVGTAYNGKIALEMLKELRPDILIADIRMPVLDGLELIKQANLLERPPHTIITSGYDDFRLAQTAIKLGVSDYLLKPITKNNLENTLNTLANKLDILMDKSELEAFETLEAAGGLKEKSVTYGLASEIEEYLRSRFSSQFTLEELARRYHITPAYLSRIFKKAYDMPPLAYLTIIRIEKSKQLIASRPDLGFRVIAELVGYPDAHYFSKLFKKTTGMTLSEYKESIQGLV